MSAIPFMEIPTGLLVPGFYSEIDMSLAGGGSNKKIVLIIAQMLATGTAEEGKEYVMTAKAQGHKLFGIDSDCAVLAENFLDKNTVEELRVIGIKDKADGIAAVYKVTFTLNSHKAGTVPLYVNGIQTAFGISGTDAQDAVRNAAIAAVNSTKKVLLEASAGTADNEMLLTAFHKGETGNKADIRLALFNETVPEGVSISVEQTAEGSGNPDLDVALSKLKEIRYHYILDFISDAANMVKLETELDRRYTGLVQKGCRSFVVLSGSETDMTGYADANRNNPHVSFISRGENPESRAAWLGRAGAVIIRRLADDPTANVNGIKLGLQVTNSLSFDARQRLLEKGISTWTEGADGLAYLERQVTSYTQNADGDRDTSYLDIQIPEALDTIREYISVKGRKSFAGYKLARTSENFGGKVMRPDDFKSFLLSTYKKDFIFEKQWCQDFETYKASVEVYTDEDNGKTRMNYKHRPQLIGQFLIGAGVMQPQ